MVVLGECPYDDCDNFHAYEAELGVYTKHECEKCKRIFWIRHSAFDPVAIIDEAFNELYIVEGNKIKKRGSPDDG